MGLGGEIRFVKHRSVLGWGGLSFPECIASGPHKVPVFDLNWADGSHQTVAT